MTRSGWSGVFAVPLAIASLLVPVARAEEATTPADKPVSVEVEDDDIEKLPDNQKAAATGRSLARMRELLTQSYQHLEEARNEKDMVKLNCVNTKLTRLKGLLKIAEQGDVAMQEGIARRDSETAEHEYQKIILAHRKVEQLLAEIEACVGELAVYAGDTEVELELTDVPEEDPLQTPTGVVLGDEITRPVAASPYQ